MRWTIHPGFVHRVQQQGRQHADRLGATMFRPDRPFTFHIEESTNYADAYSPLNPCVNDDLNNIGRELLRRLAQVTGGESVEIGAER